MRKNTIKNKIIIFTVIFAISTFTIYPVNIRATDDVDKTTYIVQMKDSKSLEDIAQEFEAQMDNECENDRYLENENCIVLDLTQKEAKRLERTAEVTSVEEDIVVKALTLETEEQEGEQWNLNVMNVSPYTGKDEIKVAIIDSGVSASSNIQVKKRANFIQGEDEVEPLYEDSTGHGTGIASVIAGKGKHKGVVGVNPNAKIYSARVLDEDNSASISRIIAAIYWCIDEDVDIINMSFGTNQDSSALHQAVTDAKNAGILMIGAAGNNGRKTDKRVQYPAAYPEVVAVASVDTNSEVSDFSSVGDEVEILAPGECIPATDLMDGVQLQEGTSISAAEVSGIASVLWSKDNQKPAGFIRELMNVGANNLNGNMVYGYGIADLGYCLDYYDTFSQNYINEESYIEIPENNSDIPVYEEEQVRASWTGDIHRDPFDDYDLYSIGEEARAVMVRGSKYADIQSFRDNIINEGKSIAYLNGFGNYFANYLYMIRIARTCYTDGMTEALKVKYPSNSSTAQEQKEAIDTGINIIRASWNDKNVLGGYTINKENKGRFLMGMAAHIAMDAYAHKAGEKINGVIVPIEGDDRDNTEYVEDRYYTAREVCSAIITEWKVKHNFSILQFKTNEHYEETFYMEKFAKRAEAADPDTWNSLSNAGKNWFISRSFE